MPEEATGAAGPSEGAGGGANLLRSRRLVALAIGVLTFGVVIGLRLLGGFQTLELAAYDAFLRQREPLSVEESPIVVVRIREQDLQRYGYPVSDALLARALETILAAQPRAIGVDLYRDAPVPRPFYGWVRGDEDPEDYAKLADVAVEGQVVVIEKLAGPDHGGTRPPHWLEGTGQVGFSGLPVDSGGVVRRGLLFMWVDDLSHTSFGLQLAARYLADEEIGISGDPDDPDAIWIGPTRLAPFKGSDGAYVRADDKGFQYLLDYRLGSQAFPNISLEEVLSDSVELDVLRDKIVFVGTTAPSVKDEFYTPFHQGLAGLQHMYGVDLQAHATYQLVRFGLGESRPIQSLGNAAEAGWVLVWTLLGAALGLWQRSPLWTVLAVGGGVLGVVAAAWLAFEAAWWIPVVPPALAGVASASLVTAYGVVLERYDRRQATHLFSRFLRPQVMEQILREKDQFMRDDQPWRPRSRWVTLTTLMLDLEGYTAASEKTDAYILMDWVNEFAGAMAELVDEHGGVVDDYAGDGIKANFGFPVPSEDAGIDDDAANAVRCALDMGRAMERLNESWRARELPEGRVRIGITTGRVVMGVLGGEKSLKYTTVGDPVNAAARLESFDKDSFAADPTSWRVLIGEETKRRLDGRFQTLDLGEHSVKGKQHLVHMYRVLGFSNDSPVKEGER